MEKIITKNIGSLWPRPCAAKRRRQKSRGRLDAEKNSRAHAKVVTETLLEDALSFVVEGNSYFATPGFLVRL